MDFCTRDSEENTWTHTTQQNSVAGQNFSLCINCEMYLKTETLIKYQWSHLTSLEGR